MRSFCFPSDGSPEHGPIPSVSARLCPVRSCFPLFAAVIADPVIGVDRPSLLSAHTAEHTDRTEQQCANAAFAGTEVFSLCCGLVDHAAILTAALGTFHFFSS